MLFRSTEYLKGKEAQQRIDWIAQLQATFKQYGLESLAPKITEFVQQGYSPDTVSLKLADTPEYQQRFSGNAARIKAGLSVLSPAEYLATERSYEQIMRASGLPKGFYDNYDDFSKFIASDVSPTELKSRVDVASLAIDNADPYFVQSLQDMYGLTKGDMIAHALDPERALPFIQKQAQAIQFGAAARKQGLTVTTPIAEQYAGAGVTSQQAQQGFEAIAQIMPTAEKLTNIYNTQPGYTQEQAIAEAFTGAGSAEAAKRRQRLLSLEQAQFGGSSGTGKSAFAQQQTGQF